MNKKRFLQDWSLWPLLGMNIYLIVYYTQHPNSYSSIVALYWVQSVSIGFFNFLALLTVNNVVSGSAIKLDGADKPGGCVAFFFLVHYGIFHLVYLIFLASQLDLKQIDWLFVRLSVWIIFISTALNFVQDKIRNRNEPVNIGAMFFMPYARIVPMHLMILLPKFFNISAPYLFLCLKTIADVVMHVIYQRVLFKQPEIIKKKK